MKTTRWINGARICCDVMEQIALHHNLLPEREGLSLYLSLGGGYVELIKIKHCPNCGKKVERG